MSYSKPFGLSAELFSMNAFQKKKTKNFPDVSKLSSSDRSKLIQEIDNGKYDKLTHEQVDNLIDIFGELETKDRKLILKIFNQGNYLENDSWNDFVFDAIKNNDMEIVNYISIIKPNHVGPNFIIPYLKDELEFKRVANIFIENIDNYEALEDEIKDFEDEIDELEGNYFIGKDIMKTRIDYMKLLLKINTNTNTNKEEKIGEFFEYNDKGECRLIRKK